MLNPPKTAVGYHYANHPTKSVDQIRDVVFSNFDISANHSSISFDVLTQLILQLRPAYLEMTVSSFPDVEETHSLINSHTDQAAMATVLIFHLLGLYPGQLSGAMHE